MKVMATARSLDSKHIAEKRAYLTFSVQCLLTDRFPQSWLYHPVVDDIDLYMVW
jgi:hypothetical protein